MSMQKNCCPVNHICRADSSLVFVWEESISRTLFLSSIFLTRRPLWLAGLGPEFNWDDLHSFRLVSPYVTGGFNPLPLNPLPSRGLIVVEMTYHLIKMTMHAAAAAVSSGMWYDVCMWYGMWRDGDTTLSVLWHVTVHHSNETFTVSTRWASLLKTSVSIAEKETDYRMPRKEVVPELLLKVWGQG